jgi:hypothetical protein
MGTPAARPVPARPRRLDPRRTRRRQPRGARAGGRADGAGRHRPARVPAVVGHRRGHRGAARRRPRRQRLDQAPARPRRPRAEAALRAGRAALLPEPASRAAEQPALLRRAHHQHRPARDGRPRLVPPRRAAARRPGDRRGPRDAVGAQHQADADGGRRDPRGPRQGQGHAGHLRPPRRRPARRARAAARPAAQDRRHARRARPRRAARQDPGRARSASTTSSPGACRRPSRCWSRSRPR